MNLLIRAVQEWLADTHPDYFIEELSITDQLNGYGYWGLQCINERGCFEFTTIWPDTDFERTVADIQSRIESYQSKSWDH